MMYGYGFDGWMMFMPLLWLGPGYYTLHTTRDGKITGMLSVHATTGAVWYHTWHGEYIDMREATE